MRDQHLTSRWLGMFPELLKLDEEPRAEMLAAVQVKRLSEGDVAYYQGQICEAYLMCIEGRTRVFKTSESGREILLYQVCPGETCVLTTSCLMAGRPFPAESTAESDVILVALPTPVFHRLMKTSAEFQQFVMGNTANCLPASSRSLKRWPLPAWISVLRGAYSRRPTTKVSSRPLISSSPRTLVVCAR